MMWRAFESAAPEMAAFGKERFEGDGVANIATIRSDGSPRISCVLPFVMDGELYLGMLWRSRKALDLLRDPRLVIRNAICTNTGKERELTLRGQAAQVLDPETRARYVEALADRTEWREPHFHLFSVDVQSAALIQYEGGEQTVKLWPRGTEFRRAYG